MKKPIMTGLVALAALLYGGCGSTGLKQKEPGTVKQPHDTRALGRAVSLEKDWSWDVEVRRDKSKGGAYNLSYIFWAGLPKEVAHFQFFIDTDNNPKTGFTGKNGWEITGADYLVEDEDLYKYVESVDKGWHWEHYGSFIDFDIKEDDQKVVRVKLSGPDFQLEYAGTKTPTMMEVYDQNWNGDYPTVLDLTLNTQPLSPPNNKEKHIRHYQDAAGHNVLDKILEDGTWIDYIKREYNDQGLVSKKIFYSSMTSHTYTYNEKGDISRLIIKHLFITLDKSFETTYNEAGQKTEEKVTTKEYRFDKLKSTKVHTYRYTYDAQGRVTHVTYDGKPYKDYTYDNQGRVKTMTIFDSNGVPVKETYTYDAQSRKIRQENDRFADGTIESEEIYTYLPLAE